MYIALVAAILVFFNSVLYLQRFFYYEITNALDPIPPHIHAFLVTDLLVPGLNLLYISLVIVGGDVIVYAVFRVFKKKRNKNK